MTPPLISVIIPAYNAATCVAEAVASAQAQTYQPLEILVIDDGSTDDTAAVLAKLDGDVRVLQQPNAGPAAARNLGLREAQGELIAFLDADDRWEPEKLAVQWQVLSTQPEIGLVHTNVTLFDPQTGQRWQREVGRTRFVGRCTGELLLENRILASSVLVRRCCLEQAGSFDEQFKGVEDYDLWLRLSRCCAFDYVSQPLVQYRMAPGSLSSHSSAMRDGEWRVVQKAWRTLTRQEQADFHAALGESLSRRFADLAFDVAYQAFQRGEHRAARRLFAGALAAPTHRWRSALLWCATLLPAGVVARLRRWKNSRTSRKSLLAGS